MAGDPTLELVRFQAFISDQVEKGEILSPEEALDLWRAENPSVDDFADTVQALSEALADMDGGDTGVSLEEFDCRFRQRHGLPLMS